MARVRCPGCDRSISLTPEHEGKKVRCKCGKVFRMPSPSRNQSAVATAAPARAAPPAPPIQFSCPTCAQLLQVDASFAGQLSACPCGTQVTVPAGVGMLSDPLADPLLSAPLVSQDYGQPLASSVPAYHKRELASREKAARAQERAKSNRKKKKKGPARVEKHDDDEGIAGSVWAGLLMMIGAGVWFTAGIMGGVIFYYPPVMFVIGLCTCIQGALFGDDDDDW